MGKEVEDGRRGRHRFCTSAREGDWDEAAINRRRLVLDWLEDSPLFLRANASRRRQPLRAASEQLLHACWKGALARESQQPQQTRAGKRRSSFSGSVLLAAVIFGDRFAVAFSLLNSVSWRPFFSLGAGSAVGPPPFSETASSSSASISSTVGKPI